MKSKLGDPIDREAMLEAALQQSYSTIQFLHDCLTQSPAQGGNCVYGDPKQTTRWLDQIRLLLEDRNWCFHVRTNTDCASCMDGARWREVWAEVKKLGGIEDGDGD